MQFRKQEVSCLDPCLSQVQTLEQTQEVRLPEGSAGAGRILAVWGQPVMRSKEWLGDIVRLNGGATVWVLYETEEGQLQCISSWIPFRMDWDLPDAVPEGWVRIRPVLRSVDARAVSAGKLLIRVGIAALAEGFCPRTEVISVPETVPEHTELLRNQWPLRLRKEAGEKAFEMEEELKLPDSVPGIQSLISWQMDASAVDKKILGNKIVFRGTATLHVVYISGEGRLCCWDFELPFSQYADLSQSYGTDAQGDVSVAMTRLELEQDAGGLLHLRAGLAGQYLVDDRQMLETVEDAYCPNRELKVRMEAVTIPVLLDSRRETVNSQTQIPISADVIADQMYYQDFPRQSRNGSNVQIHQPGAVQVLYYDTENHLQSAVHRMESELSVPLNEDSEMTVSPAGGQIQVDPGMDSASVRAESHLKTLAYTSQKIPVVTELEPGEKREPDRNRPALILRRAGKDRLWDIARQSGSTVSAIQSANSLTGEPEEGRMLLIPVV